MSRVKKTDESKPAFVIKPHHDRILEAIYRYHFMTVEQVTRLLYSRGSITKVRALLGELASHELLLAFHEPRATPVGSTPKIYMLSLRGYNHLRKHGISLPFRFRVPDVSELEKNYLFLRHNLAVTDVLLSARVLERLYPTIHLYEFLHERSLKQQEPLVAKVEKRTPDGEQVAQKEQVMFDTIRVYPDGFLDFRIRDSEDGKTKRCCILLEVDRKTESEKDIKRKVRGYLLAIKSEAYKDRFGRVPTVAFINMVGGEERREHLRAWAESELKKTKEPHFWTEMFVFTDLSEGNTDSERLFLTPVWYMPFDNKPTVILGTNR